MATIVFNMGAGELKVDVPEGLYKALMSGMRLRMEIDTASVLEEIHRLVAIRKDKDDASKKTKNPDQGGPLGKESRKDDQEIPEATDDELGELDEFYDSFVRLDNLLVMGPDQVMCCNIWRF